MQSLSIVVNFDSHSSVECGPLTATTCTCQGEAVTAMSRGVIVTTWSVIAFSGGMVIMMALISYEMNISIDVVVVLI